MEEEEIFFWLCQKGKDIELRRKQIKSPEYIITFLQSVMHCERHEIGDENIPLLFPAACLMMKGLSDKTRLFSYLLKAKAVNIMTF